MKKIAVLSSYNGSGFETIQKAIEKRILKANIVAVISNNTEAKVLKSAQDKGIKNFIINKKRFPNENIDLKIALLLKDLDVDYIFLSGYMKKIEKNLISTFENKIINSHPALLPNFGGVGMYGRFVHEAVIKAKEKTSGCTLHFVNENYDEGEFILQKSLVLDENETPITLENRIKDLEAITIVEGFKKLLS